MYYLQAVRFKVCWVQQLNLNRNTLSLSFPIEALQANYISSWECLKQHDLVTVNMLSAFDRDSLANSLRFQSNLIILSYWFTVLLEMCLSNSCYLCLIAFKWTPTDLLLSSAEPAFCFSKCPHLYKGFGVNVLCSEQSSLSFIQVLSADKCMDSKYCPFIYWEGVTLTAGILPCQSLVGNMNRERQEHGALIFTVIRPCVLPAA